ncbi:tRNA (adenosine(37)-N6)-threonylcarbamoyltransferase complex transferase subunit TsaD [candidate division Kazan bacterium RIFCSPHIGHO2_01_FULL_44_14]|uniref:tRNA N6-adenosine threonylcarbamoyltransferase n=1 Tax=candidate division Kazan bacterium RIFCSPLOWO2_01_FULL_45_19 TaxID=1798538 RepID=A0A1F4NQR2_UNCK3|nr:hypothetical protein [uncultured bacterium]AQS31037.1 hypothetical protein [uncultured bacterium]OGB73617.1 MAG: tRNA (adenosine(37)-N6)-threonylcarbamoyltransferase complex transferase subunit TsaD [candidate division Kazan bacterium RIFCSPLOWO2_01_FULL_45_19]OGB77862.1 MAG: tRNA (adenosine(37)-N6)-threonylcarbamoyltransferase complex transferase subunit TsaD [candidate division Kazan bacterium RIFCSPHIGHO2_01_FULL_44_14]
MKILAIETSCDDTGVAIVENGHRVLVNLVASQEKLHATFGGVVPEVASREHLKAVFPLIDLALQKAKSTPKKIDAIAVTVGPGLLGSLLVGVNAAKVLGYLWGKPVVPVNHLMGHIYAGFINRPKVGLPVLALVVSGGHSELVLIKKQGEYKYLGGTRDDAAGEAFDKVARLLGLGYPGGPAVAAEAAKLQITNDKLQMLRRRGIVLPRPMLGEDNLDFSFSGLKTAVAIVVANSKLHPPAGGPNDNQVRAEIAHEFQSAVVDVLVGKLFRAVIQYQPKTIVLGGGVVANRELRKRVEELAGKHNWRLAIPDFQYCTDNAAMVGAAAWHIGISKNSQWYNVNVIS